MAASYPQIVLLGDSLFQQAFTTRDGFSFQAALQEKCQRRFDVVNRGFSGYNTSQALKALPAIFPDPTASGASSPFTPKLAYLVVLLGANDAALFRAVNNQHVQLPEYEKNLTAILTHPHIQAHKPQILVVTPPPLDGVRFGPLERAANGNTDPTSRQARITAKYAEAARRVAASVPDAKVIDLWQQLMDRAVARTPGFSEESKSSGLMLGDEAGGKSGYLASLLVDGLHLSGEGYRVLHDELVKHIDVSKKPFVYPEWSGAPWL